MATNQPLSIPAIRSRLEGELPPEVLEHSYRTAELARELASIHGVDADRAEMAGLLHDVAAQFSDAELLALAERHGIPVNPIEARFPKLLHGVIGATMLHDGWSDDKEILDAVRDHVTGAEHMGQLAKILFLADKLEPGQDRLPGGLDPIRELARKDLDQAVFRMFGWHMSRLIAEGRPLHERLVAAHNRMIEKPAD